MGQDGRPQADGNDRAALASLFPRLEQTFPTLTPTEIDRLRHFGEVRHYKSGELLFETGKPGPASLHRRGACGRHRPAWWAPSRPDSTPASAAVAQW